MRRAFLVDVGGVGGRFEGVGGLEFLYWRSTSLGVEVSAEELHNNDHFI